MLIDYKGEIEVGDLIFTFKRGNLFSRLIWFFGGAPPQLKVSHVAIYIGEGLIAEMSFGGLGITGLRKYSVNKYVVHIGRIKIEYDVDSVIAGIKEQVGARKYSYIQIGIILLKKLFGLHVKNDVDGDSAMCSEFIVEILRTHGKIDILPGIYSWDAEPLGIIQSEFIDFWKIAA